MELLNFKQYASNESNCDFVSGVYIKEFNIRMDVSSRQRKPEGGDIAMAVIYWVINSISSYGRMYASCTAAPCQLLAER